MNGKTAAVLGSSGMIGSLLVPLLLDDPYFSTVTILVRRPQPKTHPKLQVKLVDFNDLESVKLALEGTDIIFSCIGTTQNNVKGDNALYRRIDLEIPLNAAKLGKETGVRTMVIVTAVGATTRSRNFYLRLKGELEAALEQTGMESIHILQPSMLLGERKEKRVAEKIFQPLTQLLSPLLVGSMRKFRAIQGKQVALAMIAAAKRNTPGVYRYTFEEMKRLISPSDHNIR